MRKRLLLLVAGLLFLTVVGFTQTTTKQQTWEYKYTLKFNDLNKLGAEGWELVAATDYNGITSFYLKRPK